MTLSYEQMQAILDELADELPEEVYTDLNGGILLSPDKKIHPESVRSDLIICGEYTYDPHGLGRYIVLYYQSLCAVYGHLSEAGQRQKLKEVLHHELTHHLEHMAGDKSLERQDERDLADYHNQYGD